MKSTTITRQSSDKGLGQGKKNLKNVQANQDKKPTNDSKEVISKNKSNGAFFIYRKKLLKAHAEFTADRLLSANAILDKCPVELRGWEWYFFKRLCQVDDLAIKAPGRNVGQLFFRPDGKRLGIKADGNLAVWSTMNSKEKFAIKERNIWCAAYAPDGRKIATGHYIRGKKLHGAVTIWDADSGKRLATFETLESGIRCIAFNPDGTRLAVGGGKPARGIAKIIDADNGKELHIFREPHQVRYLAFSPDGTRLASIAKVWDIAKGKELLSGGAKIVFSPDGKRLASSGNENTVKIRDAKNGKELVSIEGRYGSCADVAFGPDGRRLFFSTPYFVHICDAVSGSLLRRIHPGSVSILTLSPDGRRLATYRGNDEFVRVSDVSPNALSRHYCKRGRSIAISPDGQRVALGLAKEGRMRIVDAVEIGALPVFMRVRDAESVNSVVFSPDSKQLASGTDDGRVTIWETAEGKEVISDHGHTQSVNTVAFSSDGKHLASGGDDQMIIIRDSINSKIRLKYKVHTDAVKCIAYSPDGKRIASGGKDSAVVVANAETGDQILRTQEHAEPISFVAFSPDGERLTSVSGNDHKDIKVWDLTSGKKLLDLTVEVPQAKGSAFSYTRRRLASGFASDAVRVWTLPTK